MKTFTLEFVTPEKVALRDEVESVVVPAFDGELGVLAGHAPLLAQTSRCILIASSCRYCAGVRFIL